MTQNNKKSFVQPLLIMPCGPSGSGKSTLYLKLKKDMPGLVHYSWDQYRLDWYSSNYSEAFKLACADKNFMKKVLAEFDGLVRAHRHIYVDNTNTTVKSRAQFLDAARAEGYKLIAYEFKVSLEQLLERQKTRTDKTVPEEAVKGQFNRYESPCEYEFDEIRFA